MQLDPGNDDNKIKFVVFEQQRHLCELTRLALHY